jgi:adenylate cyclase
MSAQPNIPPKPKWLERNALLLVAITPLFATLTGSAFNIWYNLTCIVPLLTEEQEQRFVTGILWFNSIVYPVLIVLWITTVYGMRPAFRCCLRGSECDPGTLVKARARAINLPWFAAVICGLGWMLCIPALMFVLKRSPTPVDPPIDLHLPLSILISALISVTHGFFIVELVTQRLIFPILFRGAKPAETPGTLTLTLRLRGLMWALSIGACPIVSLILLGLVHTGEISPWFAPAVGLLGIVFGLISAWMLGRLVAQPLEALHRGASRVAKGDLSVKVDLLRADEFGPLIDEFNHMVSEMREKELIRETFGAHVGREAAKRILATKGGVGGVEQDITVMFCDIRNFTARCADCSAEEIVSILNLFFEDMVAVVEGPLTEGAVEPIRRGMVNQILGDGFMALFGVGAGEGPHALAALRAAQEMLEHLGSFNEKIEAKGKDPIQIGIGLNSGPAVVGSVGSPQRMQYTAIGDTTNVASRVEGLTKVLKEPLLMTRGTKDRLPPDIPVRSLGSHEVKGQPEPLEIFTVA